MKRDQQKKAKVQKEREERVQKARQAQENARKVCLSVYFMNLVIIF